MGETSYMRKALALAARGYGHTSPNPMVGAVLVKGNRVIGAGWHRGAGNPHAEIEALQDAARRGHSARGSTLYVTLEPCCTHGRTPPCTDAIVDAGIKRVVAGATDPNPKHGGRGFKLLKKAEVEVSTGILGAEAAGLNVAFNHWIVHRTPFVTIKSAMSLDGKIATKTGESKWISGPESRGVAMRLRRGSDAILVGVNTVIVDDPALTIREAGEETVRQPLRVILDSRARTPVTSRLVQDEHATRTVVVTSEQAPPRRVAALRRHTAVWVAPAGAVGVDLEWVLAQLGERNVTSLLVEGGGDVHASFLFGGFAHRVAFFYAPKVIGGREARKGVSGMGIGALSEAVNLRDVEWRSVGADLLLTAAVAPR